jgi:hypothetical protein
MVTDPMQQGNMARSREVPQQELRSCTACSWEELQRDLGGWRTRAGVQQPADAKTDSSVRVQNDEAPDSSTPDAKALDERWRQFIEKYSRNWSRKSSDETPPWMSW